jgi:hypothetical protein
MVNIKWGLWFRDFCGIHILEQGGTNLGGISLTDILFFFSKLMPKEYRPQFVFFPRNWELKRGKLHHSNK